MVKAIKRALVHVRTCNGVDKGRPGGKVLSLGERANCYHGHKMTKENTFRYRGRIWCRRCRADSRKRSRGNRARHGHGVVTVSRKVAPKIKATRKATRKIAAVKVKATPKRAVKATVAAQLAVMAAREAVKVKGKAARKSTGDPVLDAAIQRNVAAGVKVA